MAAVDAAKTAAQGPGPAEAARDLIAAKAALLASAANSAKQGAINAQISKGGRDSLAQANLAASAADRQTFGNPS